MKHRTAIRLLRRRNNQAGLVGSVHVKAPSSPIRAPPYSAIESYPVAGIGANGVTGRTSGAIVGGPATQLLTVEGRQMHGAPDWSRSGPPTIFGSQQKDR